MDQPHPITARRLLSLMKSLPDFSSLDSFIHRDQLQYGSARSIWRTNEFSICESISKTEFGALWEDAVMLLHQQIESRCHSFRIPSYYFGNDRGILNGGSKIGFVEVVQMYGNRDMIRCWKGGFIRASIAYSIYLDRNGRRGGLPFHFFSGSLSPDLEFRIDRAFYRCAVVILIHAAGLSCEKVAQLLFYYYGVPDLAEIFQVCSFTGPGWGEPGGELAERVAAFIRDVAAGFFRV
jgi:hypothetical protein